MAEEINKNVKLKSKRKLFIGFAALLAIIICSVFVINIKLKNAKIEKAKDNMALLIQQYAREVENGFLSYVGIEDSYSKMISDFEEIKIDDRREYFKNLLEKFSKKK